MGGGTQATARLADEGWAAPDEGPGTLGAPPSTQRGLSNYDPHPAGKTRHVLVVEDDAWIRTLVAEVLQSAGYGVLQAGDGFEALRRLQETRPDLIVLDLMLPGMSGWQFLEQSRDQLDEANVPVVILSAIEGRGDYPDTLGVAAWLTKPLDVERFLHAVEDLAGPPHHRPRTSIASQGSSPTRVLVVEDERAIRELLVEYFASEGYVTEPARSIDEATAQLTAATPALIVLDLMLPGRSGWDFLRQRQRDQHLAGIPVLVLSAAPQARLAEAKALGADAFLSKPFDLEVLSAVVQSFVR